MNEIQNKIKNPENQTPYHSSFSGGDHLWSTSGSFAVRDHLRSSLGIISGLGTICGPVWGSFAVWDHLRSSLGIICGSGSFAVQFGDHLRFGVICGPIWGSFAVGDHLRRSTLVYTYFHESKDNNYNNTLIHRTIITREKKNIYIQCIQQMRGVLAARNNLKVINARQPVALN